MEPSSPSISVVIPTRNRPEGLRRCLEALDRGTAAVETVVVEDSRGNGPAAARNEGIGRASGEIVLFVDDDCVPDAAWAETLAAATRRAGCAAGRSLAPQGAGAAVRASQAVIDALQLDPDRGPGDALGFAPACNLGCSRELLERVRFDEGFPLAAGEDRDFCNRLVDAGFPPVYEPSAVVVHEQAGGVAELLRRQYRYGRGAAHLFARRGAAPTAPGFRRRLVRRCFDLGPSVGALTLAGQAATAAGYARERIAGVAGPLSGAG